MTCICTKNTCTEPGFVYKVQQNTDNDQFIKGVIVFKADAATFCHLFVPDWIE